METLSNFIIVTEPISLPLYAGKRILYSTIYGTALICSSEVFDLIHSGHLNDIPEDVLDVLRSNHVLVDSSQDELLGVVKKI